MGKIGHYWEMNVDNRSDLYYLLTDNGYVVAKGSGFKGVQFFITKDLIKYNKMDCAIRRIEKFKKDVESKGYELVYFVILRPSGKNCDSFDSDIVEVRQYHYAKIGSWKRLTKEQAILEMNMEI